MLFPSCSVRYFLSSSLFGSCRSSPKGQWPYLIRTSVCSLNQWKLNRNNQPSVCESKFHQVKDLSVLFIFKMKVLWQREFGERESFLMISQWINMETCWACVHNICKVCPFYVLNIQPMVCSSWHNHSYAGVYM
jgi:hypothetical protein